MNKNTCCVCLSSDEIIGVSCNRCHEGKCCWPCALQLAEQGSLGKCPVCRTVGWRGERTVLPVTLHPDPDLDPDQDPESEQTIIFRYDTEEVDPYENYDDTESVCLHIILALLSPSRRTISCLLNLLVVTWLRGLALVSLVSGNLAFTMKLNTSMILAFGELANTMALIAFMIIQRYDP